MAGLGGSPVNDQTAVYLNPNSGISTEPVCNHPPGYGLVQVAIKVVLLSRDDISYYGSMKLGEHEIRERLIAGHEAAGEVVCYAPDVTGFSVGDKVVLEPGMPCRHCESCRWGALAHCTNMDFCGSVLRYPHRQGFLRDRVNHPAWLCHKLPVNCPLRLAALAHPLCVINSAVEEAGLSYPMDVLILGAGPTGFLCGLTARSKLVKVHMVDHMEEREQFAFQNGAADRVSPKYKAELHETGDPDLSDFFVRFQSKMTEAEMDAILLKSKFDIQAGFDVVFDCTGTASPSDIAMHAVRPGGTIIKVSSLDLPFRYPATVTGTFRKVVTISSCRYTGRIHQALQFFSQPLNAGAVSRIKQVITHQYSGFAEAESAFQTASLMDQQGPVVMKVAINLS